MPYFSAPDALELLKKSGLDIPFIIVSGAIGEEMAVTAMKAGAHDYIMKDNLTRLIPAINRELREAKVRQEHRQAEEEKEKIQIQLFQSQKMEAIGTFTGGIAHDFNNLITAILGCAELASNELNPSDPIYEELNQIQIAATRAAGLTRQLLLFSRKQKMEFLPLNLNLIIKNLIQILRRLIGEDIHITTALDPKLLTVLADLGSIEQTIMNLAVNARDAMPEGGNLIIKTENVILDEATSKSMPESRTGQFTRLSMIDSGSGIAADILPHIFEPFFSTKGVNEGTGLGLSVVYGIIKQHEGWICAASEMNKGSVFDIYLPTVDAEPEKITKPEVTLAELQGHGERILMVEDEQCVQKFASKALSKNGYEVYTASTAKDALELFEKENRNFHLILSDVVLPDKSGLKLADELLGEKPELKILMSSGYIDHKSHWQSIKMEGRPYLQKPYALIDLLKTVKEVLA
jgi:signal transduction histidine kinase